MEEPNLIDFLSVVRAAPPLLFQLSTRVEKRVKKEDAAKKKKRDLGADL